MKNESPTLYLIFLAAFHCFTVIAAYSYREAQRIGREMEGVK